MHTTKTTFGGDHRTTAPLMPPNHPAFVPVVRAIAETIATQGPRAAADLCNNRLAIVLSLIDDAENSMRLEAMVADVRELEGWADWLCHRADELRVCIA